MLIGEARWFQARLLEHDSAHIFPLCNLGSSILADRTSRQPWVEQLVIRPLVARGRVVHVDMQQGPGVDVVGDVTNPRTVNRLAHLGFRSVLCSNLLEHVETPAEVAKSVMAILPRHGYVFASCPYRFPYHPAPIDNRFRPTPGELAAIFPGARLIDQASIVGETYGQYISRDARTLALGIARVLVPFYRPLGWISGVHALPWLFRHYEASCVVLQKL